MNCLFVRGVKINLKTHNIKELQNELDSLIILTRLSGFRLEVELGKSYVQLRFLSELPSKLKIALGHITFICHNSKTYGKIVNSFNIDGFGLEHDINSEAISTLPKIFKDISMSISDL